MKKQYQEPVYNFLPLDESDIISTSLTKGGSGVGVTIDWTELK